MTESLGSTGRIARSPLLLPSLRDVLLRWTGTIDGIADHIEKIPEDARRLLEEQDGYRAKGLADAIERLRRAWAGPIVERRKGAAG